MEEKDGEEGSQRGVLSVSEKRERGSLPRLVADECEGRRPLFCYGGTGRRLLES